MTTLTYGLKRPSTRDSGSTLWTALEDNITQLDGHTHNGVNSARLSTSAIAATTQSISSGSWVATSQGNYRQLITLSGLAISEINIGFKDSSGNQVLLEWEYVSASTYYVYTNDNSASYTAVYTS